jgi:hypothetical protein
MMNKFKAYQVLNKQEDSHRFNGSGSGINSFGIQTLAVFPDQSFGENTQRSWAR